MDVGCERAGPTLIALRRGDPVVAALRVAGPGPVVIARVLPMPFGGALRGGPATAPAGRLARAELVDLVGRRRPATRLVIRFGDTAEQVAALVDELRPGRVIAARDLASRLAAAAGGSVVNAEDGTEVRRRVSLARIVTGWRRALGSREDEKLDALRSIGLFDGVGSGELRRLATLLDGVEVGPGHRLVAEGRRNDTFWILLEGLAVRSIGGRELGRLGRHALVGAPSLIYDRPAIATVTALAPTRALVAGRAQFMGIQALESVALRLRAATADRLRDYVGAGAGVRGAGGPLTIGPVAY